MDHIKLTKDQMSVEEVTDLVVDPECGAISLFIGTTRNNFEGKSVVRLEYEAYEGMAEKEMAKLCRQAREKWTLKHIAIYHRLGVVPVTESSVIIAVSSGHRKESLEAVAHLIDALKASVPIWKKEIYDDGNGDWKKNKECKWAQDKAADVTNANGLEASTATKRRSDDSNVNEQPVKKIKKEPCDTVEIEEQVKQEDAVILDSPKDTKHLAPYLENKEVIAAIDPNRVQIIVSKNELQQRIEAFQQRKRQELDVFNVQEFCTLANGGSTMNSCARTSAVVLRSKGSNSHLKLTKVVNEWGPQTVGLDQMSTPLSMQSKDGTTSLRSSRESSTEPTFSKPGASFPIAAAAKTDSITEKKVDVLPEGIEERMGNLEGHLRISPGGPLPRDVYSRLKCVEDRLLHLEGISPEYFMDTKIKIPEKNQYKKELKAVEDDISLDEIDFRIHQIKMKLKQRQINKF